MSEDKGILDHISEWFKILLSSGIPALLIGLGWVSVFLGSIWLGTTWNSGAGFWVLASSGVMMILLGVWLYKRELAVQSSNPDNKEPQRQQKPEQPKAKK